MMTRTFASVAVMAALGLSASMHANAFGLGKLELSSALNEPFKAEIAITALKDDEADNLQVRLASSKEFEQAGIERNFLLTQLKFEVVEKSGQVKIVISSQQPIREPFIDFLLTAITTSSGRLIREYTVLLDPPKNIFNKPTVSVAQNPTKVPVKMETVTTEIPATSSQPSASYSGNSYGPITRTDTLWDVALRTKPENNISVPQMMMALFRANPNAFQYENVNGLKAGYTLSIPSASDIYKLTKDQAHKAFTEQNTLWANRNVRPLVEPDTADKVIAPEITPAIDKAISTADETMTSETNQSVANVNDTARLKLVAPNEQPSVTDEDLSPLGAEKIKVLSQQLTLAQETIEGQTQENIDFKSRMDALEVQMETMRRLISLKDADLARLQSMLEQDQQADEVTAPIDATVIENSEIDSTNEPIEIESLQSDELDVSQLSEPPTDSNSIEGDLDSLLVTAQKFVTDHKTEMAIGAGSLLLLLVALLIAKRRKDDDVWEEDETQSIDNDEELFNEQSNNLDDDKQEKAINVIEAEQVIDAVVTDDKTAIELIAEAEVLVADSNYEKAMKCLEEAQKQEPENQLVLTKLLHVMFKLKLTEPFVALASRLDIDQNSAEWFNIAAWGREIAPLNTLFQVSGVAEEPEVTLDFDEINTDKDDVLSVEPIAVEETIKVEENSPDTIEFNLDDYATDKPVNSADDSNSSQDELDSINEEPLTFDTAFSLDDKDKKTDFDTPLHFENDLDETVLSLGDEPLSLDLPDETYQPEVLPMDDSTLEFDISGYDEIDEAETKLDLASAYADMGDPDGARNILEEVLKEGNDEQKLKAQVLLKNLS